MDTVTRPRSTGMRPKLYEAPPPVMGVAAALTRIRSVTSNPVTGLLKVTVTGIGEMLVEAGADLGLRPYGARALTSMRLEKSFGNWAREFRPIYGPFEAGLDRFVAYGKPADFIGKQAALAERESGGRLRLRAFVVDAVDADVIGDEPIWHGGAVRGWVTSGGYAHNAGKSIALGYVPREIADSDEPFEIEFLGRRHTARLQPTPLFDGNQQRLRG